jgi:hypothetical protein
MRVLVRESLECWIVRALIDLKLVALEFFLSLTIVSALSRRTPIFLSLLPACVRAALLLGVPSPLASFATRDGLADTQVLRLLRVSFNAWPIVATSNQRHTSKKL